MVLYTEKELDFIKKSFEEFLVINNDIDRLIKDEKLKSIFLSYKNAKVDGNGDFVINIKAALENFDTIRKEANTDKSINEAIAKYYYVISFAYIFYLLGITTSEELRERYKGEVNIDTAFYRLYEKIINDKNLRELRLLIVK